ncbi:precorrin-8X methylmutase [Flexivirga sp. ID2601S]|uniref:Precorrin-8X methylmutase n=1 Tax=Flexivirga aerilata TaxID=1656889 RepID=A0A849AUS4_9MICO|nr:precorrin-8X methylmutase [Flexivirga aerilata]NNG40442.1 precorrin-8X methylmutase [Flexivirga aerilata]
MIDKEIRRPSRRYDYQTDGLAIYKESFGIIRAEAPLHELPESLRGVAVRVAHAAGDTEVVRELAAHPDVVEAARAALDAGGAILTDSEMLARGVTRRRLPARNEVLCTLRDPRVPELATEWGTTRSAAAVSLWRERLDGAVVAIGNAPTALFHLLELLADGAPRPAAIVGMPVGFVGSAESKSALAEHELPGGQVPWLVVRGRRGGSAMAAAALNALANPDELA